MKAKRITITVDAVLANGIVNLNPDGSAYVNVTVDSGDDFDITCTVEDVEADQNAVVEADDVGYSEEEE